MQLHQGVVAFQTYLLPTFRPPAGASSMALSSSSSSSAFPACPTSERLTARLGELQQGLALLQVIVEAKLETMVAIRERLQEEKMTLERRVRSQAAGLDDSKAELQALKKAADEERVDAQLQIQRLQEAADAQLDQMQSAVEDLGRRESEWSKQLEAAQAESSELHQRLAQAKDEAASEKLRAQDAIDAVAGMDAELSALRAERTQLKAELSELKVVSKFLKRGGGGAGGSGSPGGTHRSKEIEGLMRTTEHLMREVDRLKRDKALLQRKLDDRQGRGSCLHKQAGDEGEQGSAEVSSQSREVELVLDDRLPESAITHNLINQRINNEIEAGERGMAIEG